MGRELEALLPLAAWRGTGVTLRSLRKMER